MVNNHSKVAKFVENISVVIVGVRLEVYIITFTVHSEEQGKVAPSCVCWFETRKSRVIIGSLGLRV